MTATNMCSNFGSKWCSLRGRGRGGGGGRGGLHLKPPKFEHIFVAAITFPLSSVQILLIPSCCLLCVLSDDMKKSL